MNIADFDVHCGHCGCIGTIDVPNQGGLWISRHPSPTASSLQAAKATTTDGNLIPFDNFLAQSMQHYQHALELHGRKDVDVEMHLAFEHVSSCNLGVAAFDAVKAFFERRSQYATVKLIVAEDNEAVIKILAKGRSAKLRHINRTHRVNTDWLYECFRRPEVLARYVSTDYQIADLGTKAITKGDVWHRLTRMMGVKPPGKIEDPGKAANIWKNNANEVTTTKVDDKQQLKYMGLPTSTYDYNNTTGHYGGYSNGSTANGYHPIESAHSRSEDRAGPTMAVAQDIARKDWMKIDAAKDAVGAEWKRLRDKKT